MADSAELLRARFGIDLPGVEVPPEVAPLLDRRVTRRYTEQPVPDSLLDALLAAAQSAPTKSDLQQYSVVVMRDPARIKQIADWIGTMDWIAIGAGVPGVVRRHAAQPAPVRACTACRTPTTTSTRSSTPRSIARWRWAQFIAAAEAVGLGTCPISYVRSHIERVTPLLSLPPGVYPVAGLTRRLAGVPPPRIDAPAAIRRGASRTLRRQRAGRRNRAPTTNAAARASRSPPAA